jgi:hypothetical protein
LLVHASKQFDHCDTGHSQYLLKGVNGARNAPPTEH